MRNLFAMNNVKLSASSLTDISFVKKESDIWISDFTVESKNSGNVYHMLIFFDGYFVVKSFLYKFKFSLTLYTDNSEDYRAVSPKDLSDVLKIVRLDFDSTDSILLTTLMQMIITFSQHEYSVMAL